MILLPYNRYTVDTDYSSKEIIAKLHSDLGKYCLVPRRKNADKDSGNMLYSRFTICSKVVWYTRHRHTIFYNGRVDIPYHDFFGGRADCKIVQRAGGHRAVEVVMHTSYFTLAMIGILFTALIMLARSGIYNIIVDRLPLDIAMVGMVAMVYLFTYIKYSIDSRNIKEIITSRLQDE